MSILVHSFSFGRWPAFPVPCRKGFPRRLERPGPRLRRRERSRQVKGLDATEDLHKCVCVCVWVWGRFACIGMGSKKLTQTDPSGTNPGRFSAYMAYMECLRYRSGDTRHLIHCIYAIPHPRASLFLRRPVEWAKSSLPIGHSTGLKCAELASSVRDAALHQTTALERISSKLMLESPNGRSLALDRTLYIVTISRCDAPASTVSFGHPPAIMPGVSPP